MIRAHQNSQALPEAFYKAVGIVLRFLNKDYLWIPAYAGMTDMLMRTRVNQKKARINLSHYT